MTRYSLNLFAKDELLLCREDFVMRNGATAFVKEGEYSIKQVILYGGVIDHEYILVNRRGDNHILTETDVARHFVTMEIVNFEQNELDRE